MRTAVGKKAFVFPSSKTRSTLHSPKQCDWNVYNLSHGKIKYNRKINRKNKIRIRSRFSSVSGATVNFAATRNVCVDDFAVRAGSGREFFRDPERLCR